jgi:radical SAM/Cys-rich protein
VEQNRTLRKLKLTKRFAMALRDNGWFPLSATEIEVMQLNVGKVCNQTCGHCHVDAGPDRKEVMSDEVLDRVLEIFETSTIGTLDITGGAPELHPRFREIVRRGSLPGRKVMHRCNLTAIMTKPHWDIPDLLAELGVEIVASLPCYTESNCDAQRGDGVFETSIKAIRRLNELGYGKEGSGLVLNLVYNPVGASLPPEEAGLQATYKRKLDEEHGLVFNRLFALTNLPISRFLEHLVAEGKLDHYMSTLVNAFNPQTIEPLMCRNMVSIGWDGGLYDCDFNQMLDLKVEKSVSQSVFDWDAQSLQSRSVVIGEHCFGCTAGAGSSCGGQTA